MSNLVRSLSESDQTPLSEPPPNFIPWDLVDRSRYEVIHPEKAMDLLGMSSRTAHRKINSGELLYTTEKGAKRVLVERQSVLTDKKEERSDSPPVVTKPTSVLTDNMSDKTPILSERILELSEQILQLSERLSEKDRLLQEKDQLLLKKDGVNEALNNQLMAANTALQKRNLPDVIDPRQKEIEELKALLAVQAKALEDLTKRKPWWRFW